MGAKPLRAFLAAHPRLASGTPISRSNHRTRRRRQLLLSRGRATVKEPAGNRSKPMSNADMLANGLGLEKVRAFWDTEACGSHFVENFADERDFFSRYRQFRYRTEWHIPAFASFPEAKDKQLLEIGCGNGAEGVMFARHGAHYTGVDLTREALDASRRHFAIERLPGKFQLENAESLGFPDNSFDIVYSFGVLHHTPVPQRAVAEVHRVLRPGGVARVMLYHRNSFNYYVRILGYMRARVLLRIVSRIGHWDADRARLSGCGQAGVRGNRSRQLWDIHYVNFLGEGWRYLTGGRFVHHCTDGPECPCAYTYSRRDAAALFAQFRTIDMAVGHLPLNKYPGGQWLPRAVERFAARTLGWHLLITASK
jgi:SAM-dependent methyltransferase